MDLAQERIETLATARDARRRAVMHYQIDIDNFAAAVALIDSEHEDDAQMVAFGVELADLLATTRHQQARERLILRVIEDQLPAETAHVG